MKKIYINQGKFIVSIRERNIASFLQLKKHDQLLVSSKFWDRMWLETFFKVGPEPPPINPDPTFNSGLQKNPLFCSDFIIVCIVFNYSMYIFIKFPSWVRDRNICQTWHFGHWILHKIVGI